MVKKTFNPPVLQALRLDLVKVICASDPAQGDSYFGDSNSDIDDESDKSDEWW